MREQTDGVLTVSFLTDDIDVDAVAMPHPRVPVVDFFWSHPRSDLVDSPTGVERSSTAASELFVSASGGPGGRRHGLRPGC